MDFVAIDFETANEKRDSICSVGIVMVRNGEITNKIYSLIRPFEMRFAPINMSIHHIKPSDVVNSPTFAEFWPTMHNIIDGNMVLAHNASFDISAMRAALTHVDEPFVDFKYGCTRIVAKKMWPRLINYSLDAVSEFLSISFQHHNALEDARACAEIALRGGELAGITSLDSLFESLNISTGAVVYNGDSHNYVAAKSNKVDSFPREISPKCYIPHTSIFDRGHPFFNRDVVFTGKLESMERPEAIQGVVDKGGFCTAGVTLSTNFLVVGSFNYASLKGALLSTKIRKARELTCNGHDLEIINEKDFLRLLDS